MSATLGPIHHWLYRKIQIQRQVVSELLHVAQATYPAEQKFQEFVMPWPSHQPLEAVIDASNIHGWLQGQIHQVEQSLAKLIADILFVDNNAMPMMKQVFEQVGKSISRITPEHSVTDMYQEIQDSLLDGMPCDRVNVILHQSEHEIVWQRRVCLHEDDYTAVGLEVSVYYELRDALIRGLIANACVVYETPSEATYRITGGQA